MEGVYYFKEGTHKAHLMAVNGQGKLITTSSQNLGWEGKGMNWGKPPWFFTKQL